MGWFFGYLLSGIENFVRSSASLKVTLIVRQQFNTLNSRFQTEIAVFLSNRLALYDVWPRQSSKEAALGGFFIVSLKPPPKEVVIEPVRL